MLRQVSEVLESRVENGVFQGATTIYCRSPKDAKIQVTFSSVLCIKIALSLCI